MNTSVNPKHTKEVKIVTENCLIAIEIVLRKRSGGST